MSNEQYNIQFRPKTTARLLGYSPEKMERIIDNARGATSILITGVTGTGKTTLALALAQSISDDPQSIKEVNAGADGTIADIRALIAISKRRTLSGKRRINIIDEAHKMTKQSMDALLTPMEVAGGRSGTLWIFCTNEPERLPQVFVDRCLRIETPSWSQADLLKLAKRVNKKTDLSIPTDKQMKLFANPRQLLLFMQGGPPETNLDLKKANVSAAKYLLHVMLGNPGDKRKLYDFKYSTIMEISLAIRAHLGVRIGWEEANPELLALVKSAEPRAIARVANACAIALKDPNLPPMNILDILIGSCAAPYHFGD